jgi:hypothetical protein
MSSKNKKKISFEKKVSIKIAALMVVLLYAPLAVFAAPIISTITPYGGTPAGGTSVTITGNNFEWYKEAQINNMQSGSVSVSNYQMLFTLDTASLISAGKMRSDCRDLGVIKASHSTRTKLFYFIESGCNTSSTKIWVKVPQLYANTYDSVHFVYGSNNTSLYGSYNNPEQVFDFYDTFDTNTLGTKWFINTGSTLVSSDAQVIMNTASSRLELDSGGGDAAITATSTSNMTTFSRTTSVGLVAEARTLTTGGYGGYSAGIIYHDPLATGYNYNNYSVHGYTQSSTLPYGETIRFDDNGGGWQTILPSKSYTALANTWYRAKLKLYPTISTTNYLAELWNDSDSVLHSTISCDTVTCATQFNSKAFSLDNYVNGTLGTWMYVDWFRVYKLAQYPPTYSWGVEQNSTVVYFGSTFAPQVDIEEFSNGTRLTVPSPTHSAGIVDIKLINFDLIETIRSAGYIFTNYTLPRVTSPCCNLGISSVNITGESSTSLNNTTLMPSSLTTPSLGTSSTRFYTTNSSSLILNALKNYSMDIKGGVYQEWVKIWVDSNFNNIFESTEQIIIDGDYSYSSFELPDTGTDPNPVTKQLKIPYTGATGTTVMRIGTEYRFSSQDMDPNGNTANQYGEYEDYTIQLAAPPPPEVLGVIPNTGSTNGGQSITILGNYFYGSPTVDFYYGTNYYACSNVTLIDDTSISCTTPSVSLPNGTTTSIVVTTASGAGTDSSGGYTYNKPPEITYVQPYFGNPTLTTPITIYGNYFYGGRALSVTVDGRECTNIIISADLTSITCDVPANDSPVEEYVDIQINAEYGNTTKINAFRYAFYTLPTVTNHANNNIGITGIKLAGETTILENFSNTPPNLSQTSTPPSLPYPNAYYTNYYPYEEIPDLQKQHTYYLYIKGTANTKINAWIDWNMDKDFIDAGEKISSSDLMLASDGSYTIIPITVPENAGSSTYMRVGAESSSAANMSANGNGPNTYGEYEDYYLNISNNYPLIESVTPNKSLLNETQTITISGKYFDTSPIVKIGGEGASNDCIIDPLQTNTTQIVCTAPTGVTIGPTYVRVGSNGLSTTVTDGYEYVDKPIITLLDPNNGSTTGGTIVSVSGKNFSTTYIRQLALSGIGTELTDYQIRTSINTSTLITAGKMRSDCGDLRIYDEDQITLLPYYIEPGDGSTTGCNTLTTYIWTKIPIIPSSGKTINISYGDPSAYSQSNGDNVFIFFDDFDESALDQTKWDFSATNSWVIETSSTKIGKYSAKAADTVDNGNLYITTKAGLLNIPSGSQAIIDFYWKVSSEGNFDFLYYCKSDDSSIPSCTRSTGYINRISGNIIWTQEQSTGTLLNSGPHRIKFAYEKDVSISSGEDTGWIDHIKVRKYSASEPEQAFGIEKLNPKLLNITFNGLTGLNTTIISNNNLSTETPPHPFGTVDTFVTNSYGYTSAADPAGYETNNDYTYTDTTPPTGSITINSGAAYTNSTTLSLTLSATDAESGVDQMQFSCDNISYSPLESYATTKSFSLGSYGAYGCNTNDGTKIVYVKYKDNAGNLMTTAVSDSIILDTTPPTGSLTNNGPVNEAQEVTFTASYSDPSGSVQIAWDETGTTCSNLQAYGSITTKTKILNEPGTFGMSIKVIDSLGNESGCISSTTTWTNLAPTVSVLNNGPKAENTAITYTALAADEGGTTFSYQWYSESSCSSSSAIAGAIFSTRYETLTEPGTLARYVITKDAQDAPSTCEGSEATWTNLAPYPPTYVKPPDNIWTNDRQFCATVSDPGGGLVTAHFVIGGTTYPPPSNPLPPVESGGQICYTHTSDLNGVQWYAYAKDANDATTNSDVIYTALIDTTQPTVALSYNPSSPVKVGPITITATYSENVKSSQTPQISIDQPGTADLSPTNMTMGANRSIWIYTYNVQPHNGTTYQDGTATVTLSTVSDEAGNPASAPPVGTNTFIIDTQAPTGSITINNGDAYTASPTLSLALSATDGSGSSVSQMQFSCDNISYSPLENYETSKLFTLSEYSLYGCNADDGPKTIHVKYADNAGNLSTAGFDTITLDTVGPSGGSISYTNGYQVSTAITLTLDRGTDAGSGINPAADLVEHQFTSLIYGSGICDFSLSTWQTTTLAGNIFTGTTGNCYKFRYTVKDNINNTTLYTSESVTKIASAPTISSINPSHGAMAGGTSVTIIGTNFLEGASVTVGGAAATNVTVISSTSITLSAPPGDAGAANIVVTNPDGQSNTLVDGFTYETTTISTENSTFNISPSSIMADGIDSSSLIIVLQNEFGTPLANISVLITHTGSDTDLSFTTQEGTKDPLSNTWTTSEDGRVIIESTSIVRGTYTFTAVADPDVTAVNLIQQPTLTVSCAITGDRDQCLEVYIEQGTGELTLSVPSSFSFPNSSTSTIDQHQYSIQNPSYILNTNDYVTVSDTRNNGGFTLQLSASAFADTVDINRVIPGDNLFVATKASNTEGTPLNGVEYLPSDYLSIGGLPVTAQANTDGEFNQATSFTYNFGGAPVELINGSVPQGSGRTGTFRQNVQYYLKIPAYQPPGVYQITLTFDLIAS